MHDADVGCVHERGIVLWTKDGLHTGFWIEVGQEDKLIEHFLGIGRFYFSSSVFGDIERKQFRIHICVQMGPLGMCVYRKYVYV